MRTRLPIKGLMEIGGNLYAWDRPYSNIFLLSEYHLFYLEVNLMPYGFLLSNGFSTMSVYVPIDCVLCASHYIRSYTSMYLQYFHHGNFEIFFRYDCSNVLKIEHLIKRGCPVSPRIAHYLFNFFVEY